MSRVFTGWHGRFTECAHDVTGVHGNSRMFTGAGFTDAHGCSRMFPDVPGCSRMFTDAQGWFLEMHGERHTLHAQHSTGVSTQGTVAGGEASAVCSIHTGVSVSIMRQVLFHKRAAHWQHYNISCGRAHHLKTRPHHYQLNTCWELVIPRSADHMF